METTEKLCKGPCGLVKPLTDFSPNGTYKGERRYRAQCRDCKHAQQRTQYAQDADFRAAALASNARWARANPERKGQCNRAYGARNPMYNLAKQQRRRARKAAATVVPFTHDELLTSWEDDGLYACVFCGGPFEEIEHLVPLSRGGEHSIANLVPSCIECNRGVGGKHSKMPWDWLAERFPELAPILAPSTLPDVTPAE